MPARAVAHHETSQPFINPIPRSSILFSACVFTLNSATLVPHILASDIVVTFTSNFFYCPVEVLSCSAIDSHYSTSINLLQRRI